MSYGQYSLHERPLPPTKPAKQKKLKHVWDDPSHVWAHPRQKDGSGFEQEHARNPQGNIYFKTEDDTRTLFSYRDSYPIASCFEVKKKLVYLLRSGKPYSVTTARHFTMAANATRNADRVFRVPFVIRHDLHDLSKYGQDYPREGKPDKATHAANVKDYADRIIELIAEYGRVRSSWSIANKHSQALAIMQEVKAYCKLFALKLPKLPKLPELDTDRIAKAKTREEYNAAHAAEIAVKREAQRAEQEKERIAQWKRGEINTRFYYGRLSFLRVVRNPETGLHDVQTSQGVSVPVSGNLGAARLLRFLESLKTSGRTYHTNGHSEHIGQFTVSSFDGQTLIAGCHAITWDEIASVSDAVRKAEETDNLAGIAYA